MMKVNSIFIVDDDPITVFGIKRMLKPVTSCEDVEIFQNGKEAFDALVTKMEQGDNLPNVIFLDINMPIMDGWDFLEEMLQLPIEERIVINILTSSIDPMDHQKWNDFKSKCSHVLNFKNKPIFKIETSDLNCLNMAS